MTEDDFNYYVHGLQGFWQGYMKGLYNSNTPRHITDLCLNDDISKRIANMIFVVKEQDFFLIFDLVRDFMAVTANIDECGLEKSIIEVEKFCLKNDCSPPTIFGGLAAKAFQIFDKLTTIADMLQEFPGDDAQEVFDQGQSIGKALGSMIRIIFNFQHH
ncbi:UNKNOWN [Stylonychia lemnae]|uniref:Uncharacterized protein n=1 Tax=Stylonychia lemnae TaxID=5949 RepID=A0A078AN34_STYLE|nr:UNKNOWN [Stylonychia lemnae]|eukprot:CDW83775.1 UNKNOWN [Stylonychia lemnae]